MNCTIRPADMGAAGVERRRDVARRTRAFPRNRRPSIYLGPSSLGAKRVAIIFGIYLAAFWFVYRRQRFAAYLSIGAALGASFAMYLYHADSALGLNF